MEQNFVEITKKIESHNGDPLRVPDMLRSTVFVPTYDDLMAVFKEFNDAWDFDLIKVVNEITTPLRRVTLCFIFCRGIAMNMNRMYGSQASI